MRINITNQIRAASPRFFSVILATLLCASRPAVAQEQPAAENAAPAIAEGPPAAAAPETETATTPATAVAAAPTTPPAPAQVMRVKHVPPISVPADEELSISAVVENSHLAKEIRLYVRQAGSARFERLPFRRQSSDAVRFIAVIPVERMTPGVIEYFIASQGVNQNARTPESLHFASPDDPHQVIVRGNDEARWRRALLGSHFGNRSRFQARVDYVNFGDRKFSTGTVSDFYVRGEADYTYRILGWVYSIRLGGGLLLGRTYLDQAGQLLQIPDDKRCETPNHSPVDCRVGMYYGFAELRFRFGRLARLDLRPILGVGPQSFDGGASAQLIIGHDPGTHVALGFEGISHIGVRGWLRLAWDTVPHVPMSFTIDAENFPNNDAFAMRLMMGFSYRFHRHFSADLTAGYATRGWQIGGPTVGGGLIAEF